MGAHCAVGQIQISKLSFCTGTEGLYGADGRHDVPWDGPAVPAQRAGLHLHLHGAPLRRPQRRRRRPRHVRASLGHRIMVGSD